MDSPSTKNDFGVCDGVDHGVSGARVHALNEAAQSFNQVLHDNQSDRPDHGDGQKVFDAGRAFYEELTQLPVGERRALVKLAEAYNQALSKSDQAMPKLTVTIDADAFLEQVKISYPVPFALDAKGVPSAYFAEDFTYNGRGMCAESHPGSTDFTPVNKQPSFEIELPSLH